MRRPIVLALVTSLLAGSLTVPATASSPAPEVRPGVADLLMDAPVDLLDAPVDLAGTLPARERGTASDAATVASSPTPSVVDRERMRRQICPSSTASINRARRVIAGHYQWSPHPEVTLGTRLTWREDPLQDANWRFQFHALRWLWPLIDATHRGEGDQYLRHAMGTAQHWVATNPTHAPVSSAAWYDHAAAWRALVLGCLSMQTERPPAWLHGAMVTHRDMLANPSFYVDKGNHALNQDIGLLAVACLTDSWSARDLAVRRITRLVTTHVDAQGVMDEQAPEYQWYNFERYRAAADAIEACGVRVPAALARIDAMPLVMAQMMLPDGTWETIGDSDRRGLRSTNPHLQWLTSGGTAGSPPPVGPLARFDAGFVFARSGWGVDRPLVQENLLTARFGPRPVMHGHDDHGSLTLWAQGQRLLTDPGKYAYSSRAERRHVVSREAHNVVTVGRTDCVIPDDPALLRGLVRDATTDRFRIQVRTCRGTSWARTVVFVRATGEVIVVDDTVGPPDADVVQRWQLEPGARVSTERRDRVTARWPSGASLLIEQLAPVRSATVATGARSPLRGWVSLRYNELTPAPNVQITAPTGQRSRRLVTVLRPGAGIGSPPASRVRTVGGATEVTVTTASGERVTTAVPLPTR